MFTRIVIFLGLVGGMSALALAQDEVVYPSPSDAVPLVDDVALPSHARAVDQAMLRRMEIAQRKAEARRARIDARLWLGQTPGRPMTVAMPQTSSLFYQPPQPVIYVYPWWNNPAPSWPMGYSARL